MTSKWKPIELEELPLNQALRVLSEGFPQNPDLHFVYEEQRTLVVTQPELGLLNSRGTVARQPLRALRATPAPSRLLLVEDERELARAMARVFQEDGIEVTVCHSCRDAAAIQESFPAAVFDVVLPDGSGIDLAERMRDRVQHTVFFSAASDLIELRRAQSLGVFVSKAAGMAGLRSALGMIASSNLAGA